MDKDGQGKNLASEVRLWVAENLGRRFTPKDIDSEIGIYSELDKNNRWHILRRLEKEKLIEKYRGSFRVVTDSLVPLNWQNADESLIKDIKFPFGIEKYVRILPKNIIIVAGEKEAGKTAFLLNVTMLNMDKHNINYYSSEMGELELKSRLQEFEKAKIIDTASWNFRVYEKAFDFQDAIAKAPDDIHIIDFLEVHKDFWEVSGLIFQIWDKLKNGVAVIALQKNKGADLGLGGGRSTEKARLYLSMEPGKLIIMYGKNWAQAGVNPKNKSWNFKLVGGCKFITQELDF